MKKIYTIEKAYSGNSKYKMYENGKLIESFIDNDYNMSCHIETIESKGYVRGFSQEEVRKAENAVKEAQEYLEYIRRFPMV